MKRCTVSNQSGYTLIELLLYISIVSVLLTAVTVFFGTTVDSRVKNQSISEVNDQGTAVMDYITQTIRNASSITTPTAASFGPSLTLVVPTGSLSPTIFDTSGGIVGYSGASTSTDVGDDGAMQATKFTAGATGTVKTLYAFVGANVSASPNNLGQMAIYSGSSSFPTTLLANSPSTKLLPNSWIAFNLPSPISVTSGQIYWLVYNTNGTVNTDNDINYHPGLTAQSISASPTTYGSWPASPPSATWNQAPENFEFCMYAPIFVSGSPSNARVKEGAAAAVALSANNVEITGLSFQNLTRAGTGGVIRISFTASRVNPNNRNEYDYQRNFTATAEVGW